MNSLTDKQITDILHKAGSRQTPDSLRLYHNYPLNGCYSKDELPSHLRNGWYVVNMENYKKGDGTHWVALNCERKKCDYFDSFGFPPPVEIQKACRGRKIMYNTKEIQDYNSSACGFYCIGAIVYSEDGEYNKFITSFSDYTKANDTILYKLLKKKKII
jgi:hypothetical protein